MAFIQFEQFEEISHNKHWKDCLEYMLDTV